METKVSGSFDDIFHQVQMKDEPFNESFKKVYESFNISSDHYASETANEITKMYSWGEVQEMDDDDLYEEVFGVAMGYVDGDDEDFNAEVQEIADKAFEKVRNNPFNESITPEGIKCDCCGDILAPDEVAWHSDEEGLDTCFDCEEDAGTAFIPKNWEYEDDIYEHDEDDYEYEDDFTDRDMGEMYGNYRGDASFFESKLLPNERIMEATIGERLSNIGRAIKDGLSDFFNTNMLGSFASHQADDVADKFWKHLKALQGGLDSIVDSLYIDGDNDVRIREYYVCDMWPSEEKQLGGKEYLDKAYGKDYNWKLRDLIKHSLLNGGKEWAKELKWVHNSYNKSIDTEKVSPREFFLTFVNRVEQLAKNDLTRKNEKEAAKTQRKLDKENHISKKDRELAQMRKDFLGESFKQIYEGQTTFINHIGEKDSFDDPYNTGKSLAELDAEARMDDVPADSVEYWYKRLSKGLNFDTPEGLADAAWQWECEYTSDTAHDLAHDGGRLDAQRYSRALQMIYNKVVNGALNLGLTSKDTSGSLSQILADREKWQKNKDAAAKRKATMAANAKNRIQSYIEELRNADLPAEVRELFADDGYYKERRSYGVIKNYFDKPYGKALKAVWKDQFAN